MELNLIKITDEDIKKLEDWLFENDPILKELSAIRDIDSYREFDIE